jgi:PAS domain-containing protein
MMKKIWTIRWWRNTSVCCKPYRALAIPAFTLFDIHKRQVLFYSSNFGQLLGYARSDYEKTGQQFFIDRIHPDDALNLSKLSVSIFKIFNAFSSEDKLSHKIISEYRMLNAQGKYTRLIEQYQMVELDKKGQLWLMLGVVDISSESR